MRRKMCCNQLKMLSLYYTRPARICYPSPRKSVVLNTTPFVLPPEDCLLSCLPPVKRLQRSFQDYRVGQLQNQLFTHETHTNNRTLCTLFRAEIIISKRGRLSNKTNNRRQLLFVIFVLRTRLYGAAKRTVIVSTEKQLRVCNHTADHTSNVALYRAVVLTAGNNRGQRTVNVFCLSVRTHVRSCPYGQSSIVWRSTFFRNMYSKI